MLAEADERVSFNPRIMAHDQHAGSDLKVGLLGLGLGIVWIFLVGAIAYFLAT